MMRRWMTAGGAAVPGVAIWMLAAGLVAGLAAASAPASAQSSKRVAAEEILRKAVAAQKSRKHDTAIRLFGRAISSGALARRQMTYALYRRAVSHRETSRPAQAISDLNSALFFKGGLTSANRAAAIEERARAFKDVGLSPTPVAAASESAQWSPSATTVAQADQKQRPRVVTQAPRRVLDAPKPVAPRRPRAALAPGQSILGEQTAATKASRRTPARVPAFDTRVEAAPVKQPSRTTSERAGGARTGGGSSYSIARVERGQGVTRTSGAKRRVAAEPAKSWDSATETRRKVKAASRVSGSDVARRNVSTSSAPSASATPRRASIAASEPTPPAQARQRATAAAQRGRPGRSDSFGGFIAGLFGGGFSPTPQGASRQATGSVPASEATATAVVKQPAVQASSSARRMAAASSTSVIPAKSNASSGRAMADVVRARDVQTRSEKRSGAVGLKASPARSAAIASSTGSEAGREPAQPAGKGYEIEVAVLRDRFRAEALARQLDVQYGGGFWNKKSARVMKKVAAEEGEEARYTVRLGTYEQQRDTADVCSRLTSNGFKCVVVRR